MQVTIKQALQQACEYLQTQTDTARLDAEILLCKVLNKPRSHIHAWPEQLLDDDQQQQFQAVIEKRHQGHPVAYLVGEQEFWSLNFIVNAHTLIPRPETELLVEKALALIPQNAPWHIADLGTGSGIIACAIAYERPHCQVTAVDIASKALDVAKQNADRLGLKNIQFIQGHWFEQLGDKSFELIASNPPYVAEHDPHLQQGDLRFEPATALSAGTEGLNDIRAIIQQASKHLSKPGHILIEHGWDQRLAIMEIFQQAGYTDYQCHTDLAGVDRLSTARIILDK